MKKTLLLLIMAVAVSGTALGQRVWNFGNDNVNFPLSSGIGAGPDRSVFVQDLGIHTGAVTGTNMGSITAHIRTFGAFSWVNRFQFHGAGYTGAAIDDLVPATNRPTQRFITLRVTGPGTITIHGMTGNAGQNRRLFVTDGTNLISANLFPASDQVSEAVVNYTGGPAVLFMYCNAAINLYRLEATSATTHVLSDISTNVARVLSDKGIQFNGREVLNPFNVKLEVFNVVGKRIATSNTAINVAGFEKGIYFVRSADVKGTLKFSK